MKMKRSLVTMLAAVMGLSVALAGCAPDSGGTKTVDSVKIVATKTEYVVGDTVNYADFKLTVTYSDNTTKTDLDLTSEGVTHTEISTAAAGEFDLTATYEKKSDTIKVTVAEPAEDAGILSSFELPQAYTLVQKADDPAGTQSTDRATFMKAISYEVGDDNGFIFEPQAMALDFDTQTSTPITNVKTEFELFVKGDNGSYPAAAEKSPETYVTKKADANNPHDNNTYYFTEAAVGKTFKLVITPSEDYELTMADEPSVTVEFTVVDGYNVYDQLGLSVFDNLNIKHWAAIKTAAGTLPWDLKPLAEYNAVAAVVLHANINIDPDELPDYYFWDKDRVVPGTYQVSGQSQSVEIGNQGYDAAYGILNVESDKKLDENDEPIFGYAEKLNGSLRDWSPAAENNMNFDSAVEGDQKEAYNTSRINMQKAIYCSTGTNISGNGMTISYTTEGKKHKLYEVLSNGRTAWEKAPVGHWALFKYEIYDGLSLGDIKADDGQTPLYAEINDNTPTVKNVNIKGNMPRLAETEGDPAQLMGFNTRVDNLTLENVNASQLYVVLMNDKVGVIGSNADFTDCKFFDVYSNMTYSWRSLYHVNNCIMRDAGGPIFILCDSDRTGACNDGDGPRLYVDDKSVLVSDASGSEPWYDLNNAKLLFTQLKNTGDNQDGTYGILKAIHEGTQREPMHKDSKGTELFNVIAVLIPEPDNLMGRSANDPKLYPSGIIRRGTEGNYTDDYSPSYRPGQSMILQMAGMDPDKLYETNAPMFISGTEKAIYIANGAFPFLYVTKDNVASTTSSTVDFKTRGTDWLFITMRATVNDARFGILLGNVTDYTAP